MKKFYFVYITYTDYALLTHDCYATYRDKSNTIIAAILKTQTYICASSRNDDDEDDDDDDDDDDDVDDGDDEFSINLIKC